LIIGPTLDISRPESGLTLKDPLVEIVGVSQNINFISLNDSPIFVDKQGNFREKILLQPGYNITKLFVSDRYGREKEKFLELVYDAPKNILPEIEISTTTTATSTKNL
jgi:hypothetical protein